MTTPTIEQLAKARQNNNELKEAVRQMKEDRAAGRVARTRAGDLVSDEYILGLESFANSFSLALDELESRHARAARKSTSLGFGYGRKNRR